MGFRRFSFRGLVEAEWTLVCLALNIKRLTPSKRHEEAIVHPQTRAPDTKPSATPIRPAAAP